MKTKSLAMLLFAATLGLGSCDDIQDLNLNFGDRTYINDYKGLIDAVNNLNLTLKERMDALSLLLKQGLADIQVSIDANTGAITIVGQNIATLDGDIKDGLSTINTTLFNGFKAVCTQIDATGTTIVAAIDNNGNLLRLQIDSTGKLLSAQMITSTEDLIKVLKENNASLAEKLELIDAAIQAGFADEKTSLDAVKAAIEALKDKVEAGTLSNKQAIDALTEAVKSQTTSLETKLAAIEEANKVGLATLAEKNDLMKAAIDALAAEVKAGNKSNADALAEIKNIISSQTTELSTKIAAVESAIKNGLADEKTALGDLKTAIDNFKGSQDEKMAQIITALADLKTQSATNTSELTKMIEETAYSNGIKLPSDFPDKVVMAPSAYEAMMTEKSLTGSSATEAALLSKLNLNVQTPVTNQMKYVGSTDGPVLYPNGSPTGHTCFKATQSAHAPEQIAANLLTDANGKQYYEVYKTEEWVEYTFTLDVDCAYPYLKLIEYKDARGTTKQTINSHVWGGTWNNIRVYYIATINGNTNVCVNPEANAWCIYYEQTNIADYDNK